ncbi:MaoC/PaaZ C-terminal domain-containing protein [Chloroflexota bacterium]
MAIITGLFFEEVEVGSELPVLTKKVKLEQMAMYAAACWDFEPGHYDSGTAQKEGFRAAYVDGPMITAFLGQMVSNWMGINGRLVELTATYRVMVFPGDELVCKGKVVHKQNEVDSNLVKCEVWAENQSSERAVYGAATVELPSRPKESY